MVADNVEKSEEKDTFDVQNHVSWKDDGAIEVRGPTNTLYEEEGRKPVAARHKISREYISAMLTSNAAIERQKEMGYRQALLARGSIEGVPAELVLHLLDIHWSRHHYFLLTYRPAFYRDLMHGGK